MKANDMPARSDFHFSDGETVREVVTALLCPYTIQKAIEGLGSIQNRDEDQAREYDRLYWMYSLIMKSQRTGRPVLGQGGDCS